MTERVDTERFRRSADRVRLQQHDPEAAHSEEDDLHRIALTAIAAGAENASEIARIALSTSDLEFERWCG